MTLKSFDQLKPSPAMLARSAARDALDRTVLGLSYPRNRGAITDQSQLIRLAMRCGQGEMMVRTSPEFKAAEFLL